MGASSSAINPTQDFLARMGGGRLFEVGASAVKYGMLISIGNHMNSSAIWEIIALSHTLEGSVISQGKTE